MSRHTMPRNAGRALAALAALTLAACADEPLSPRAAAPADPRLSVFDGATETAAVAGPASELMPAISGTRIAYRGPGNGGADLYVYDVATGATTRIVPDTLLQDRPAISGDHVLYVDLGTGSPEVRAQDLRTGENFPVSPVGPGTAPEFDPAVSGTRVVYTSYRHASGIYMYDLVTRTEIPVRVFPSGTTPSRGVAEADIGGDLIVWREQVGWPTSETTLMLHDLRTGVTREIARSTGIHYSAMLKNPATDGVRVVYEDYRDGTWDIYMFDPATGAETRITRDSADQRFADIDGNVIVWQDHRHGAGNAEIYGYDLAAGTEHRLTSALFNQAWPSISGNRIVWQDGRRYDSSDVYMLTLAGL